MESNMLVNTNWLSKNYNDNNLIILDASYYVDGGTIKAKKLYEANHIPNAIFFDIDKIADLDRVKKVIKKAIVIQKNKYFLLFSK